MRQTGIPELPRTPPKGPEGGLVCQRCGQAVFPGERVFTSAGQRLCPDCFREEVAELTLEEWADLLGVLWEPVD